MTAELFTEMSDFIAEFVGRIGGADAVIHDVRMGEMADGSGRYYAIVDFYDSRGDRQAWGWQDITPADVDSARAEPRT